LNAEHEFRLKLISCISSNTFLILFFHFILEPEMGDLNYIVIPKICAHWEEVAYALRFKIADVDAISEMHSGKPKKCCRQLLKEWLSSGKGITPKTWPMLLAILGRIDDLAAILEEIKTSTVEVSISVAYITVYKSLYIMQHVRCTETVMEYFNLIMTGNRKNVYF